MFNEGRRVVVGGKKTTASSTSSSSSSSTSSRNQLLDRARQEREQRENVRKQNQAVVRIQAIWRAYRTRNQWQRQEIGSLDNKLATIETLRAFFLKKQSTASSSSLPSTLPPPSFSPPTKSLLEVLRLTVYTSSPNDTNHPKRLSTIGKLLQSSIDKSTPSSTNIVSLLTVPSNLAAFSAPATSSSSFSSTSTTTTNSTTDTLSLNHTSTVPTITPSSAQYIALIGRYIEHVIRFFIRKYHEQKISGVPFDSSRTRTTKDNYPNPHSDKHHADNHHPSSLMSIVESSGSTVTETENDLWTLVYRITDTFTNPHEWFTSLSSAVHDNPDHHPERVHTTLYYQEIASRLAYRILLSSVVQELCTIILYECSNAITMGYPSTSGSVPSILDHPMVQVLVTVALRAFNVFPFPSSSLAPSSAPSPSIFAVPQRQRWQRVAHVWSTSLLVIPTLAHTTIVQKDATHWSSEAFQFLMQHCSNLPCSTVPTITSNTKISSSSNVVRSSVDSTAGNTSTVHTGKPLHPILITYVLGNIVDLVHGSAPHITDTTNTATSSLTADTTASSSSHVSSPSVMDLVLYVQCCNSLLSKTPSILYALAPSTTNSSHPTTGTVSSNGILLPSSSSSPARTVVPPSEDSDMMNTTDTNENPYDTDMDFEVDIDEAVEEAAERNVDLAVSLARTRYLINIAHALRSGADITTIKIADRMDYAKSFASSSASTVPSLGVYGQAGNVSLSTIGMGSSSSSSSSTTTSRRPLSVSPSTATTTATTTTPPHNSFSTPSSSSKRFNTGHQKTVKRSTDPSVALYQLFGSYQYLLLSYPVLHQQLQQLKDTHHIGTLVSLLLPRTAAVPIPPSSSSSSILNHAEISTSLFSLLYTLHQRLTLAKGLTILPNPDTSNSRSSTNSSSNRPIVKINSFHDGSVGSSSDGSVIMTDTLMQSLVLDANTTDSSLSTVVSVPPLQRMWYAIITHPQIGRFFGDVSTACNEVPNLTAALTLFFDALHYSLSLMDDIQFSNEYLSLSHRKNGTSNNSNTIGNLASLHGLTNRSTTASFLTVRNLAYLNDVLQFAKTILYRVMWSDKIARDTLLSKRSSTVLELMSGTVRLFNILYDRHSRLSTTKESTVSPSSAMIDDDAEAQEAYNLVYTSSSSAGGMYRKGSPWKDEDFLWPSIPSTEITPDVILGLETADITDESLDTVGGASSSSSTVNSSSTNIDNPSSSSSATTNRRQPRYTVNYEGEEFISTPSDDEDNPLSANPSYALHPTDVTNRLLSLRRVRAARLQLVLTSIPEVVPFRTRVELFNALRAKDKANVMQRSNHNPLDWLDGNGTNNRLQFTVRRNHMLTDAQAAFQDIADEVAGGTRLKERFYVQFVNNEGMNEAGIDGGGLLKEFIDSVVKDAFAPDKGLFKETNDYYMYPNPAALQEILHPEASNELRLRKERKRYGNSNSSAVSRSSSSSSAVTVRERSQTTLEAYTFLGQLLGKALYEGILVEPRFAGFVLRKILGRKNTVDDLGSYDSSLYASLMQIKRMAIDYRRQRENGSTPADHGRMVQDNANTTASDDDDPVTNLCLTFTVEDEIIDTSNGIGGTTSNATSISSSSSSSSDRTPSGSSTIRVTTNLVPRGDTLPVTSYNIDQFINYVADYRLNQQIAPQVRAFLQGFRQLIPLSWMRMFNPHELQYLIGGLAEGTIDLNDLRRNTTYSGFDPDHPYIEKFWNVIHTFTPTELTKFLSFVTSVPRPPLLGFSTLTPKFGIVRVNIANDNEKLPTASTCFNALKLPVYSNEKVLKEKLLYAISSGAGFELT